VRPGAPLDLRGLVSTLRGGVVAGRTEHAELLADLVRAGVQGADPRSWYGANPVSSDAELQPEGRVAVSPSRVELVRDCALRWALETAGGTAPDATVQTLGTLVHAVAEALPSGHHHELAAELRRRFPELGLKPGWPATQTLRSAEEMVGRLAGYVADRSTLGVEVPFEVEVGERAVLRGVVDRVEPGPEPGIVEVVDLKTGKTPPPIADMPQHPQLGAYQLAVDAGGLDDALGVDGAVGADGSGPGVRSAGARLVYVGKGAKAAVRDQPAPGAQADGGAWATELVDGVARTMAGSAFVAQENKLCGTCPVRRACPVQPEGRRVVA
jgi:RecB family exonuclease